METAFQADAFQSVELAFQIDTGAGNPFTGGMTLHSNQEVTNPVVFVV